MSQAMILLYVGIGGAMGACSRYILSELCVSWFGRGFPYGTLFVNVLGSFAMGLLVALLEQDFLPNWPLRHAIGLGFLGALTTFSTFSMDNFVLLQEGLWLKMGLNMCLNLFLCLLATWGGFSLLSRLA